MCNYCQGEVDKREDLMVIGEDFYDISVYIGGNNKLCADDDIECEINYCPMCGRSLGDE